MSLPSGDQPDAYSAAASTSPTVESVVCEFRQLLTANGTFLRQRLLRSATLQWNGRTMRGRQRIIRFLSVKQRCGALRGLALDHPTDCEPFSVERLATADLMNQSSGGTIAMYAAMPHRRRTVRGRKRGTTVVMGDGARTDTANPPDRREEIVDLLLSSCAADTPGETVEDGFRTPPRPSGDAARSSPPHLRAVHVVAKDFGRSSSSDSSSTSSNSDSISSSSASATSDDECTGPEARRGRAKNGAKKVAKQGRKKKRTEDDGQRRVKPERLTGGSERDHAPEPGSPAVTAPAPAELYGAHQYLRATLNVARASTTAHSTPPAYRNAPVAAGTPDDRSGPPTLFLSFRVHRSTGRPHFDWIVFRWSDIANQCHRANVRRKLFDSEASTSSQRSDEGVGVSSAVLPVALPAPTLRYPNPPPTPVKRRRDNSMLHRTPSAADSEMSSTSTSPASSSTASDTSSAAPYGSGPYEYRRMRRKHPAPVRPSPGASSYREGPASTMPAEHIPIHPADPSTSGSGINLIPLGNGPSGDGIRKVRPSATATANTAAVRKPLRF